MTFVINSTILLYHTQLHRCLNVWASAESKYTRLLSAYNIQPPSIYLFPRCGLQNVRGFCMLQNLLILALFLSGSSERKAYFDNTEILSFHIWLCVTWIYPCSIPQKNYFPVFIPYRLHSSWIFSSLYNNVVMLSFSSNVLLHP